MHKAFERSAKIRTIKLGDMRVNPKAQREVNQNRVSLIAENFDESHLGMLTVSYRDGYYWIIDGQHRYNAIREYMGEGWEELSIDCRLYNELTEDEEAALFLKLNDVLIVNAFSKFTVGVTAGLDEPSDIDRIVRSIGLKIGHGKDDGSISAVGALQFAYRTAGPNGLKDVLIPIRDAWGGSGLSAQFIKGIALFTTRWAGQYDEERLTSRLGATGTNALLQKARLTRQQMGCTIDQATAASITEIYNTGMKPRDSKRVPSWWKVDAS